MRARETFHSTARQAATIALKANVNKLLLGHFSARYKDLKPFLDEAKAVFQHTVLAVDIDTIAIGLLAAYICFFYSDFWERNKFKFLPIGLVIYVGSILFCIGSWTNKYIDTEFATFYHYTLFYLVSPVSIMLCLPYLKTIKFKDNFANHFILFTSLISYSIFLLIGTFLLLIFIDLCWSYKKCFHRICNVDVHYLLFGQFVFSIK